MFNDIISLVKSSNTAIFCGAGISYNSGLPLVHAMISYIFKSMGVPEPEIEILLDSGYPFEAFMETILKEVSIEGMLEIFDNGEPNSTHELIAELIYAGYIKTVVTTNFDRLIEQALLKKGLNQGDGFEVFSSEQEFGNIDWESPIIKIIKIHGCISDKNGIAVTLEAVANKAYCINKNKAIKKFFSKNINPNVLVLGYSCSDLFDISPVIESLEKNTSVIHFIEHSQNEGGTFEDIAIKPGKNPFRCYLGKRYFTDTDYLVKEIWDSIMYSPEKFKKHTTLWTCYVDNWLVNAIASNSKGIIYHLPARVFDNIGEFNIAVNYFEKGIMQAQLDRDQIMFFSEMGNLGMALNSLGRHKEARKYLEESLEACSNLGNRNGEISQSQALGNVYKNLGMYNEAIIKLKKAVSLSEEEKDIYSLCTAIGNLASVYSQCGKAGEAIKYGEQGLEIARAIGNKQSEGSILGMLGIAHFEKGNAMHALDLMIQGINASKSIGDVRSECMALQNISNAYLGIGKVDESLQHAQKALDIARRKSLRQSEGTSLYIVGSVYYFKREFSKAHSNLNEALIIFREIYPENHPQIKSAIKTLAAIGKYIL